MDRIGAIPVPGPIRIRGGNNGDGNDGCWSSLLTAACRLDNSGSAGAEGVTVEPADRMENGPGRIQRLTLSPVAKVVKKVEQTPGTFRPYRVTERAAATQRCTYR